ncbi:MAG: hypothetical protein MZV70_43030 [Desulfobacterales bacterium]|nr:hypothetical protein [Desulfobacterales bacterium]
MRFVKHPLTRENFKNVLDPMRRPRRLPAEPVGRRVEHRADPALLGEGRALPRHLHRAVAGRLHRPDASPPAQRTNYALREAALALRETKTRAPTAVLTHGANPGLVSHFVKQALLNIAADTGVEHGDPNTPRGVGGARAQARRQGHPHRRARHAGAAPAPRSRASSSTPGRWTASSARAASPPSSAGARTRRTGRATARSTTSAAAAPIYLMQPGAGTRVRTWTPLAGHFHGFLITHGESISISDYLTVQEGRAGRLPPDRALRLPPERRRGAVACTSWRAATGCMQERKRIMMDEIVKGVDELGVLLAGHKKNAYWYGSQLSVAGSAPARAAQQRDLAAGDGRRRWRA